MAEVPSYVPRLRRFWTWLTTDPGLTNREKIVLALAYLDGHGYTLEVWKRSGIVGIGTLYVELARMEEEGVVISCSATGGPERGYRQKRSFGLTQQGWERAKLAGWRPTSEKEEG